MSQQAFNARAHFDARPDTLAGFASAGGHSRSGSGVSLDALLADMTKDGISEENRESVLHYAAVNDERKSKERQTDQCLATLCKITEGQNEVSMSQNEALAKIVANVAFRREDSPVPVVAGLRREDSPVPAVAGLRPQAPFCNTPDRPSGHQGSHSVHRQNLAPQMPQLDGGSQGSGVGLRMRAFPGAGSQRADGRPPRPPNQSLVARTLDYSAGSTTTPTASVQTASVAKASTESVKETTVETASVSGTTIPKAKSAPTQNILARLIQTCLPHAQSVCAALLPALEARFKTAAGDLVDSIHPGQEHSHWTPVEYRSFMDENRRVAITFSEKYRNYTDALAKYKNLETRLQQLGKISKGESPSLDATIFDLTNIDAFPSSGIYLDEHYQVVLIVGEETIENCDLALREVLRPLGLDQSLNVKTSTLANGDEADQFASEIALVVSVCSLLFSYVAFVTNHLIVCVAGPSGGANSNRGRGPHYSWLCQQCLCG